jgi:hypothetical protein
MTISERIAKVAEGTDGELISDSILEFVFRD